MLPPLVVVTDTSSARGRPVLDVVAAAVDGGARAVWVRDKALPGAARTALARGVRDLLDPVGGVLLVSPGGGGPADAAVSVADGVHLAAADGRPPTHSRVRLVGRSCHSSRDLGSAAAEGCHYAVLSPIFPTASKPGYGPALGPEALRDSPLPVWALGGIASPEAAVACLGAGARGVAVMGAIMGADDVACVVGTLLAVVG